MANQRWIIVGAGSAGCVLANRLSADPQRHVTLLDDGPDLVSGLVPPGIEGASFFAALAEPGRSHPELLATRVAGQAATEYQRGRGIGGSSAVNAMVALRGDDNLYQSWGWQDTATAWQQVQIPTEQPDPAEVGAVGLALLRADNRAGLADLTRVAGRRVTSAEAYLWPVQDRSNLLVRPDSPVDRVILNSSQVSGVRLEDGTELSADRVVIAAGAIHSPVVLLRSGITTPGIGHGLQDHPAAVFTLKLSAGTVQDSNQLAIGSLLQTQITTHQVQLLAMSHLGPRPDTTGLGALMAALMNPVGTAGSVTIDRYGQPVVDFALLNNDQDMRGLTSAVQLALATLEHAAFSDIVEQVFIDDIGTPASSLGTDEAIADWLLARSGDYVHASSTCAIGTVVDNDGAVFGYDGLFVCDASLFPSIPHVNTHLPTTMLAERISTRLANY